MEERDLGDSILIETTIKKRTPFSDTPTKFDPSTVVLTIKDTGDTEIISEEAMENNDTGEYYYKWDTDDFDITTGDYEIIIKAEDGTTTEIDNDFIRLD